MSSARSGTRSPLGFTVGCEKQRKRQAFRGTESFPAGV